MKTATMLAVVTGACIFFCGSANAGADKHLSPGATWVVSNDFAMDFVYSDNEMLNFDIEGYLQKNAPRLLPYTEAITHFAGTNGISARLLIAIIEQQSLALSSGNQINTRPLGKLSAETGFIEQMRDLTRRLASARYPGDPSRPYKVSSQEALASVLTAEEILGLGPVYKRLFPGVTSPQILTEAVPTLDSLPAGMQFPYPIGCSWEFNGAHPDDVSSPNNPLNCIDFTKDWCCWGNPVPEPVVSAHDGIITASDRCWMKIKKDAVWSTGYYHMDSLKLKKGDLVKSNQIVGKYADNKAQAICMGGGAGGPHVHWSLWKNGEPCPINGLVLSGWTIHSGTSAYDENCTRMYLIRNGVKICVGKLLLNEGVPNVVKVMPAIRSRPAGAAGALGATTPFSMEATIPAPGHWKFDLYTLDGQKMQNLWEGRLDRPGSVNLTFKKPIHRSGVCLIMVKGPDAELYFQRKTILK